jgi:voltage-gated potassium channel Kch
MPFGFPKKSKSDDYAAGPAGKSNAEDASSGGMDIALLGSGQGISWSNQLERFLATTHFGMLLDVANVGLSLFSFILYVFEVQKQQVGSEYETDSSGALFQIRNALNVFFIMDYLLHLFAARKKLRFILSYHGLIDLITVLPNLLADLPGIGSNLTETCFADCGRSDTLVLLKMAGYACAAAKASSSSLDFSPSVCLQAECGEDFTFDVDTVSSDYCLDDRNRDYGLGNFSTPAYSCFANCPPADFGAMAFSCEMDEHVNAVRAYEGTMTGKNCVEGCGNLPNVMKTGSFEEVCDAMAAEESSMRVKCIMRSIAVTLPLLRVLRLQRALKLVGYDGMFSLSDLNHQALSFFLTIISMVAVSSGLIHWAEHMMYTCMVDHFASFDSCGDAVEFPSFFESVYMIVMTITTVGYGDFVPKTTPGKMVIIIQMITTLIVIPRETNKILSIIANTSSYSRHKYRPSSAIHVVVCGALQSSGVSDFFIELFHTDHGNADLMAVALAKGIPSGEMMSIIGDPKYAVNIVYLDGDPMKEKDLKRAGIASCDAVFILTDKFSSTIKEDDALAILTNLSIKQFVMQQHHKDILVCMQLIR